MTIIYYIRRWFWRRDYRRAMAGYDALMTELGGEAAVDEMLRLKQTPVPISYSFSEIWPLQAGDLDPALERPAAKPE